MSGFFLIRSSLALNQKEVFLLVVAARIKRKGKSKLEKYVEFKKNAAEKNDE